MKKFIAVIMMLFVIIIFSCNNNSPADGLPGKPGEKEQMITQEIDNPVENFLQDSTKLPQQIQKTGTGSKNETTSNPDWDKKIIKKALLNLEVKDFQVFNKSIREKTKQVGGWIAMEEQNQSDYKIENIMTIKVPVDQFDFAVTQFTTEVEKLIEKKISSEDVTSEVVDTKSRLEAKKQVRLRYLDLLKQAKNMEEILNVQKEINGIQEDIESASGRIQYLGNASRYSTIHLTYYQVLNPSAKNIDEPGFATKLWASFRNGWQWIGEVIIGIISIWPLFLVVFICWILYKKSRSAKIKQA